jgi:hypothetical protein
MGRLPRIVVPFARGAHIAPAVYVPGSGTTEPAAENNRLLTAPVTGPSRTPLETP